MHLLLCPLIKCDPGAIRLHILLIAGLEIHVEIYTGCSGSCSSLDMPAAVTCSLLSWSYGASLEMFSKLRSSRRCILRMQVPGVLYWYLRWGAEGKKGIVAHCPLRRGSPPGCTGQASPDLRHQPADTCHGKCCLWTSSQSLAGAGAQPCW